MEKPIKVLSLDGGGTRGLFPATMLYCLEQKTGKPITEIFDVIAGSATGAIIAAALAAGMTTSDIMDIYLKKSAFILPGNWFKKFWNPINLFAPKYASKNLHSLLVDKFGANLKLEAIKNRFGSDTIFLFAALDLSPDLNPGETPAFKVVVYNSMLAEHEQENLVDIAMRAAAAAVNLPLYQHFTEGGNYANDPALVAFSFCLNNHAEDERHKSYLATNKLGLGASMDQIKLFSLGCGSDGSSFVPRKKIGRGNWGLLKWQKYIVNLVIDTNMVATQYYLGQMLDTNNYLRINPYYKAESAPAVLKNKKLKVDVRATDQLQAIQQYAAATFVKEEDRIKAFLDL